MLPWKILLTTKTEAGWIGGLWPGRIRRAFAGLGSVFVLLCVGAECGEPNRNDGPSPRCFPTNEGVSSCEEYCALESRECFETCPARVYKLPDCALPYGAESEEIVEDLCGAHVDATLYSSVECCCED